MVFLAKNVEFYIGDVNEIEHFGLAYAFTQQIHNQRISYKNTSYLANLDVFIVTFETEFCFVLSNHGISFANLKV